MANLGDRIDPSGGQTSLRQLWGRTSADVTDDRPRAASRATTTAGPVAHDIDPCASRHSMGQGRSLPTVRQCPCRSELLELPSIEYAPLSRHLRRALSTSSMIDPTIIAPQKRQTAS